MSVLPPPAEQPAAPAPISFDAPQSAPPEQPVFAIVLEQSDREDLARAYSNEIERSLRVRRLGSTASKGLEQDLQDYWERYELIPPDRELPFEGAANYRVPLTKWVIDSIHGRAYAGLSSVRPTYKVEPMEPDDSAHAARIEEFLDYVFEQELNYAEWLDDALLNGLVEGTAVGVLNWDVKTEHRLQEDIQEIQEPVPDESGQPMLDPYGQPIMKRTTKSRIVEREDVSYEGPRLDLVPLLDFLVADWRRKNLAEQPWMGHRTRLYAPELSALRGQEGYIDEEIDAVLSSTGNQATESVLTAQQAGEEKRTGVVESSQPSSLKMLQWYEIWSLLGWYDWDRDGQPERVVMEIAMPQRRLIRLIKYPYLHNRPNYIVLRILPRTSHFLGRSLAADMRMTQDETDATHNQRTDATAVSIAALFTFLVGEGASLDLERDKIQLGRPIKVEGDVNQIQSLARAFRGVQVPGAELENLLLSFAERLSGISDAQTGRTTTSRTTAFEIGAVIQEGNVRFKRYIERCEVALKELAYQVIGLYQQHADRAMPKVVKVLNDPDNPFRTVEANEIAGRFNYRVHGAAIASNQDLDARKMLELLELVEKSAVLQAFIKINPLNGWNLAKMVLDKLGSGDIPVTDIIGTKEELQAYLQAQAAKEAGRPEPGGSDPRVEQTVQSIQTGRPIPPAPAEVAPQVG